MQNFYAFVGSQEMDDDNEDMALAKKLQEEEWGLQGVGGGEAIQVLTNHNNHPLKYW